MIEKPLKAIGSLARKIQAVATKVAIKAARWSEAMERKVGGIEARRAARIDARALRQLPRRPTAEFVREVGHGRVSVTLYRITDHRAGTVRRVYGLNRIQPDGRRVRLATGPIAELHSLRNALNRQLGLEPKVRHSAERTPRSIERAERAEVPRQQNAPAPQAQQAADRPEQKRWYTLIYIEKFAADGTAQGRVVRNCTSLAAAKAHQERHPGLLIKERTAELPLRQGQEIPLKLSLDAAQRTAKDRRVPQQQVGLKLVVNQPALGHERKQDLSR